MGSSPAERFTDFVEGGGARIHQGLMAALGPDAGAEAAAEALAYGWEHWERIEAMDNPAGYLYRVGHNQGRRSLRRPVFPAGPEPVDSTPWVEPGLPDAVARLSERQRVVTLLVYGGHWTLAEVAELLDLDRGTVKKHADRGLVKLREALEVTLDA